MSATRELNDAQHRALDRLANLHPDAIVTKWVDENFMRGPLVRFPNGQLRVVNVSGYLRNYN